MFGGSPMRVLGPIPVGATVAVAALLTLHPAAADVVHLKSGGKVVGKVLSIDQGQIRIRTVAGTLTFSAAEAASTEYGPTPEETYAERLAAVDQSDTAGLLALADWCSAEGLRAQEEDLLRKVLALDADQSEARLRLGYLRVDGAWLPRDEAMRAKGLVQFEGRWLTPVERDRRAKEDLDRRLTEGWRATIAAAAARLENPSPTVQRLAADELYAIKDPLAIAPLAALIATAQRAVVRVTLVRVLGQFRDDRAIDPLIDMALVDHDGEVRRAAAAALAADNDPRVPQEFIRALRQDSWVLKLRASYALGELGAFEAVPELIRNLTAIEGYRREVSWTWRQGGFSHSSSSPYVASYRLSAAPGAVGLEPVFGVIGERIGLSSAEPQTVVRRRPVRALNTEAWAALVKIAGHDFGYYEDQWQAWYERERALRQRAREEKEPPR